LDAEREMAERLKLVIASWYDLLALFASITQQRRIIADQDNHWDFVAELRQDLFDKPRVGFVKTEVNGGKQPVMRRELVSGGELPSRICVLKLHLLGFLRYGLKRRNRFVDDNPRQFVFEEDRFLWRKRCWIV
jgi:hypothetical protein